MHKLIQFAASFCHFKLSTGKRKSREAAYLCHFAAYCGGSDYCSFIFFR